MPGTYRTLTCQPARRGPRQDRAFTLVELMVVVGIIGLLIAIVLPSLNAARVSAKATVTQALINNTLSTGLEQYRADMVVGGTYPPSYHCQTASPHELNQTIEVDGANLLVWALTGADLQGTPGFRNADGLPDSNPGYDYGGWTSDTGKGVSNGQPQLYQMSGQQPTISRSGPFVDKDRIKLTPARQMGTPEYYVPADKSNRTLQSLCFLDNFDEPILYYKANTAGTAPWDDKEDPQDNTGIYNLNDNQTITGNETNPQNSMDFGAGPQEIAINYDDVSVRGSFARMLVSRTVAEATAGNVLKPYRPDSYILLSAGPDGLYGTADDVGNFPINTE